MLAEVARVLKPDGRFIVTFSNRWFPPKAIRVWEMLHEYERIGLVLEYFLQSGAFGRPGHCGVCRAPRTINTQTVWRRLIRFTPSVESGKHKRPGDFRHAVLQPALVCQGRICVRLLSRVKQQ